MRMNHERSKSLKLFGDSRSPCQHHMTHGKLPPLIRVNSRCSYTTSYLIHFMINNYHYHIVVPR